MEELRIENWLIRFNRIATCEAHAKITSGYPESCACVDCTNFIKNRNEAYPPKFQTLLHNLGIIQNHEAEVVSLGPLSNGLFLYSGWFHFVGEVIKDPGDHLPIGLHFRYFFTKHTALVPTFFNGEPIVQIEFETEVSLKLPTSKID